jgi:glutaredoxin 3
MLSYLFSWFQNEPVSPAVVSKVEGLIKANKIVVFSKSYCPYCTQTKQLLSQLGASDVNVIELNQVSDGAAMQDALQQLTGQRTVPNTFIGQNHIGGNSELQQMHRANKLVPMLG